MHRYQAHGSVCIPIHAQQQIDGFLDVIQIQILLNQNVRRETGRMNVALQTTATEKSQASHWTIFEAQQEETVGLSVAVVVQGQFRFFAPANIHQCRLCRKVTGQIE